MSMTERLSQKNSRKAINRSELHSHADTCCAGPNTEPFAHSDKLVNVSPFTETYKPLKDVPIASVVTVYDDPMITWSPILLQSHPSQLKENG
jgi:hypothetical protein